MAEAIKVDSGGGYGQLLQILLYFLSFVAIIYLLYKLFGLFKEAGGKIEKKLKEIGEYVPSPDEVANDLKQYPEKLKETAEDVWTIIKGTITGEQNTPEYNEAMSNLHYGGAEWEPGKVALPKDFHKTGEIKKHGTKVKPGETKTFAGGWYTETVVNNMVKCPYAGGEVMTKEDCLARKYGFSDYANFKAWLDSVKYRLKLEGKDPSNMSLDQLVQWGRKFEKEKREAEKKNPNLGKEYLTRDTGKCKIPAELAEKMSEKELCEYVAKNCPEALNSPEWRRICAKYGITPPSSSNVVPGYKTNEEIMEVEAKRWEARARRYSSRKTNRKEQIYIPPVIRHSHIYMR